MSTILIHNAKIINEGNSFKGSLLIEGDKISKIFKDEVPESVLKTAEIIDADGKWALPGVIDTHVHFREPGASQKGDFQSESRAAVAGGVTSIMDMPNNTPQTTSMAEWEKKAELAAQKCLTNYSFYLGATENNLEEIKNVDPKKVCGIKLFIGSSTGNMQINNDEAMKQIFKEAPILLAVHCEDNAMIQANTEKYKAEFGENPIPISYHELIRNSDACYKSTSNAIDMAVRYGTRLHVLHLTTAKELALFSNKPLADKKITAETCVNYLWFDDQDYERLGAKIKCNPSIKKEKSRDNLLKGIVSGHIDTIATDHAPHLLADKEGDCLHAASGIPSIQHSLPMMLELAKKGNFSREQVVEKMCHNPARLFDVEKRGFLRKGYYADIVLIEPNTHYEVKKEDLQYKCGWSPMEGANLSYKVSQTFVNGKLVYDEGKIDDSVKGKMLSFAR
ncbi:MAG: dihydroorotase [Paludibacteraceae bacterium]|nr:dihydroorotase [Paludibacteraceae bacterium]